ncbi:carbohydrate esterase family 3 protein [Hypoxylon trugodes]|uniref:carbohydrate esterase family 3 protein n=1 Tax=Hypoxylon trugodes TaxID=326681 RepID=UPI0021A1E590|nr:carbohydrate esterase family 3 protein [Hypoxylon trugodes]KAI1389382.1 carbohydrate esterase family 3 protein [Hypoxylon trugodes]
MLSTKHLLWYALACVSQITSGLAYPKPALPASGDLLSELTEGLQGSTEFQKSKGFSNGVPLRIMPLGASITFGHGSKDGNGYRKDLRDMIVQNGNKVNMVGNNPNGTMKDNESEGWDGYRIEQVHTKAKDSVPKYKPNLILINAGTNDCIQDYKMSSAGNRMTDMINDLFDESPKATVILSTLIVNAREDIPERIDEYNAQLRQVASNFQEAGRSLVLVDMQGKNGPTLDDLISDGIHPNDEGYEKMAQVWFNGIKEADTMGYLQRADAVKGLGDDGLTSSDPYLR